MNGSRAWVNGSRQEDAAWEAWRSGLYAWVVPGLCAVAAAAISVNVAVLTASKSVRQRRGSRSGVGGGGMGGSSANVQLCESLSAADAVASVLILIGLILNSYLPVVHRRHLPYCPRLFAEHLRMGSMITSVLHLLVLAANHFFSIVSPLRHLSLMRTRHVRTTICLLWIIPPLGVISSGFVIPGHFYRSAVPCANVKAANRFGYRILVFGVFFCILVSTLGFYAAILAFMRRRGKDQSLHAQERSWHSRKLMVTMSLLMGSFVVCWLPTLTTFLLLCPEGCPVRGTRANRSLLLSAHIGTMVLLLLKLFLNPLVYAARATNLLARLPKFSVSLTPHIREHTALMPETSPDTSRENAAAVVFKKDHKEFLRMDGFNIEIIDTGTHGNGLWV